MRLFYIGFFFLERKLCVVLRPVHIVHSQKSCTLSCFSHLLRHYDTIRTSLPWSWCLRIHIGPWSCIIQNWIRENFYANALRLHGVERICAFLESQQIYEKAQMHTREGIYSGVFLKFRSNFLHTALNEESKEVVGSRNFVWKLSRWIAVYEKYLFTIFFET